MFIMKEFAISKITAGCKVYVLLFVDSLLIGFVNATHTHIYYVYVYIYNS